MGAQRSPDLASREAASDTKIAMTSYHVALVTTWSSRSPLVVKSAASPIRLVAYLPARGCIPNLIDRWKRLI